MLQLFLATLGAGMLAGFFIYHGGHRGSQRSGSCLLIVFGFPLSTFGFCLGGYFLWVDEGLGWLVFPFV